MQSNQRAILIVLIALLVLTGAGLVVTTEWGARTVSPALIAIERRAISRGLAAIPQTRNRSLSLPPRRKSRTWRATRSGRPIMKLILHLLRRSTQPPLSLFPPRPKSRPSSNGSQKANRKMPN